MSFNPGGGGGISGASDVLLSNPATDEALSYDGAISKWKNSAVSKSTVGLANVDNTSDANKPVSTATQTALDGKAATAHAHAIADTTGLQTALDAKAATAHTHTASQISDSTATGRSVLTSVDAAAVRTAIGAGTSSFDGAYATLTGKPTLGGAAALNVGTAAGTVAAGDDSRIANALTSVTYDDLPAGVTLTVFKSAGVWPARPTARTDLVVAWRGPDPAPAIVSSGTAGMLDNVDKHEVTP